MRCRRVAGWRCVRKLRQTLRKRALPTQFCNHFSAQSSRYLHAGDALTRHCGRGLYQRYASSWLLSSIPWIPSPRSTDFPMIIHSMGTVVSYCIQVSSRDTVFNERHLQILSSTGTVVHGYRLQVSFSICIIFRYRLPRVSSSDTVYKYRLQSVSSSYREYRYSLQIDYYNYITINSASVHSLTRYCTLPDYRLVLCCLHFPSRKDDASFDSIYP